MGDNSAEDTSNVTSCKGDNQLFTFGAFSSWICWTVGWSWSQDHHDWYPHCSSMVHLWWCQGSAWTPPSPTTRDARIIEDQDGACPTINRFSMNIYLPKFPASSYTFIW